MQVGFPITPHPQPFTEWVCRACDETECHWNVNADLKNIHPIMCPSSWPGFCKWERSAPHSSAPSGQEIIYQIEFHLPSQCPSIKERQLAYKDFEGDNESWCSLSDSPMLKDGDMIQILRSKQGEPVQQAGSK